MSGILNPTDRQRYQHDGIVFPIRVLEPDEAERYRRDCEDLEEHLGGRPRTVDVRQMHLHFRWACELARHERVLDAVEGLLGPNLLVWATELFAKHPQDGTISIGWHRDRQYMGFDPRETTTAWIALSESTVENGCMKAIPDPQRGSRPDGVGTAGRPGDALPAEEGPIIDVVLRPGEMSLHDSDILHGSGANRSASKRVGFVVRYVTPEARPPVDDAPALLVRGRDDRGRFRLVEPPPDAAWEDSLAGLKQSAAHHLDAMLATLRRSGR
ncbi:MAG: phytanoyl-CoA dioxygenase family protein [Planctomycetaceae bacterium]